MKNTAKQAPQETRFSPKASRNIFIALWFFALSPVLAITVLFLSVSDDELPSVELLENPPELLASVVIADDGKTELGRYWKVNRTTVQYKDISPYVLDALIATEDERFMEHSGIDFKALMRAVTNFGSAGGASTITQQLAKLLFTLQERERIAQLKAEGKDVTEMRTGIVKRVFEKVKENIIAVRLEERYTKEEIITMYLNQFDFLYNAVGIENAAKVYFNKKPADLTKSEAAMLVGMCKNPSLINPYTYQIKNYRARIASEKGISVDQVSESEVQELRSKDSLTAMNRRNQVLYQWKKNSDKDNEALKNKLSQEEYDKFVKQNVKTDYQVVDHKQGIAPYFRESLRSELSALFEEKNENGTYKIAKKDGTPYNVYSDGLKIYTSINVRLQKYAEEAVTKHIKEDLQPEFTKNNKRMKRFPFSDSQVTDERVESLMNSGRKNSDRYRMLREQGLSEKEAVKTFEIPTPMRVFSWSGDFDTIMTPNDSIRYYKNLLRAGLLSIEPTTGFVKAWVGGVDFNYFAYDQVRLGKRQVGSTIKPFVYSTAIAMGVVNPCTQFTEGASYCVDVHGANGEIASRWCPRGDIPKNASVSSGLAISSNPITVAVMSKMGGYSGPKTISKLLKDVDIDLRPEDEVPSMCLGIMDLSLYEMVGGQSMFVNQGIYTRPTSIMRIEDRNGNVIYSAEPYSKEVMNASVAYVTLEMMKGVVQFGTSTSLKWHPKWGGLDYPIAGKTGTTQNNSDGWFMGLTPDLVTGVWVGAEDRDVRFTSMAWGQGARMALPIWGYYMQKAYKDETLKLSKGDFEAPVGYDPELFSCDGDKPINAPDWGIDF
jgi:penicillin-binding protein 1A